MRERQMKKGFTIIETTLVLAISSLFAVGLMIGWNVNINRQRYEDAVNTFKSDIQSVFNEVENPKNSSEEVTCKSGGRSKKMVNTEKSDATNQGRGTTNCLIIGKLVAFDAGATYNGSRTHNTKFKIYSLVWDGSVDISKETDSIAAIRKSTVSIDFDTEEVKNLEWGANIKMVTDNRNDRFKTYYNASLYSGANTSFKTLTAILIIRSPLDGSIFTFATNNFSNDDGNVASAKNSRGDYFSSSIGVGTLLNNNDKTFNICVRNSNISSIIGGEAVYGRNKVIKIGNSAASVEIAPLDGKNGSSCGNGADWSDVIINGVQL